MNTIVMIMIILAVPTANIRITIYNRNKKRLKKHNKNNNKKDIINTNEEKKRRNKR